jgi:signal transduction histidine kinase
LPLAPDGVAATRGRRHGPPSLVVQLADGRWLLAAPSVRHRRLGLAMTLVLGFVAVALGSVPVVRRTTRRLERLEQRVEQLGTGDLSARVEVEGNDEIARLAAAFNHAAARIERLVAAQRTLLASASHELRSPLARIRVAIDLMNDGRENALHADVVRDIGVLDALIEELLLASRLEGFSTPLEGEDVDLLAIAAEECAAADAALDGTSACVQGDPRLLRHLVRNLLQNARRYAGNAAVDVTLARIGGSFVLTVEDRGPGVPEHERERIFEPFRKLPGSREGAGGGVGLGLALVARIAVLHGGQARCLARPGGGSRFEVQLPARGVSRVG